MIVSFFHLFYPLVILLNSDACGEVCCGIINAVHRKLLGAPLGSPLARLAIDNDATQGSKPSFHDLLLIDSCLVSMVIQ